MSGISAIICELNPPHEGHRYIFKNAAVDSDALIAVMSGNFVQRGESAVYDKYKRAAEAVAMGADLVLELPFPFSSSSAEFFAASGVKIAEAAGADRLFFGSECGNLNSLKRAGDILGNASDNGFCGREATGAAVRRERLIRESFPDAPMSLLSAPNDILGAQYCRFLKNAEPVPVKRIKTQSASEIRSCMFDAESSQNISSALNPDKLKQLIFEYFRTMQRPPSSCWECTGGVAERLLRAAQDAVDGDEMFKLAATKQYTNARLRRAALFALCRTERSLVGNSAAYTTVLAANERGREILAAMRKISPLPVITNASSRNKLTGEAERQCMNGEFADSLYALLTKRASGFYRVSGPLMF